MLAAQNPEYRSPAGVTYISQPDTGAVARAQAAVHRHPRDADTLLALGLAQSGIRQYREAIATLTRAIAIAPRNSVLYRWRGHRELSIRRLDQAATDLTRGAGLDSMVYGNWYHLGVVRFVRGDFAAAADAFTHARPKAPDDNEYTGSSDWLWMSAMRAGKPDVARQALATMRDSLHVTSAAAYARRIRLYRGEIGPEQLITSADTEDIQVATLAYGLGNWYLVQGDTTKARAAFERSIASGGWPAFGFIASEAELRRLK
ncbi:MAG TPA: tetratricopeptide repeat protein [Gemmatimonadales bacterium]